MDWLLSIKNEQCNQMKDVNFNFKCVGIKLERVTRFELVTYTLARYRSTS